MKPILRPLILGVLLAVLSVAAHANTLTNCVNKITPGGGISCDVYQVTATGTFSQISDVFELPTFVTPGYLVVTSNPSDPSNRNLWLDVVSFIDNGPGNNSSIQLFAVGCNGGGISCFPSYLDVVNAPTNVFLNLTGYPKVYNADENTYNIYDNSTAAISVDPVPEPASVLLLATGLLVALRGRRDHAKDR